MSKKPISKTDHPDTKDAGMQRQNAPLILGGGDQSDTFMIQNTQFMIRNTQKAALGSSHNTHIDAHTTPSAQLDANSQSDTNDSQTTLACPNCSRRVIWSPTNPHRPFCSDRCQLLDLGAWASEQHRFAGEPVYAEAHTPANPEYEYD